MTVVGNRHARQDHTQVERILTWVVAATALGLAAILVGAFASASAAAGVRYFTVGVLAALMAATVGGALGLLFGLPVPGKVVVFQAADAEDGEASAPPGAPSDWFGDNNAMEQIVDWLTKIIVGLGLIEAHEIANQFDRVAAATSAAMGVRIAAAGSADGLRVVGGTILLAYLLLGFAGVFLWARRYLKREFAQGRAESLATQRSSDLALLVLAAGRGDQARGAKSATAQAQAEALVAQEEAGQEPIGTAGGPQNESFDVGGDSPPQRGVAFRPLFPAPVVRPGVSRADDPWYGQFGGRPRSTHATIDGRVTALRTQPDLFEIKLLIAGIDEATREQLVGEQARIYLHPTFPNAIRVVAFDAKGQIRLQLVGYGAFTVGVQLPNDERLELRLDELPGVPATFRDA